MNKLLSFVIACSLIAASFISNPAFALDEANPEDLLFMEIPSAVQSVGFFNYSALKSPGYIQIYNMDMIANGAAFTLHDIMEFYPIGVHSAFHRFDSDLTGSRGITIDNNAKTLVMLDGENLNMRMHFGYQFGMMSPFLGDLKAIEVINGPGAITHGGGAINGFINMIPKNGADNRGTDFSIQYGGVESLGKLEVGHGKAYREGKNLYLYAGAATSEGFVPNNFLNNSTVDTAVSNLKSFGHGMDKVQGYAEPSYRVSGYLNHDNLNINMFYQEVSPRTNNPTYTHINETYAWRYTLLGFRPKYTINIDDSRSLECTGSVEMHDYADLHPGNSDWPKGGSESHMEGKFIFRTTEFKDHSLAVGALYGGRDFRAKEQYFHPQVPNWREAVNTKWNETGLFSEDVWQMSEKWTGSLGLRYDGVSYSTVVHPDLTKTYTPDNTSHVSPRVAASCEINEDTVLKGSYQQGFRYPDAVYHAWPLFWNNVAAANGLAEEYKTLKPETMDSYEVNLHKNLDNIKLSIDINAYYNIYTDMLHWHGYAEGDGYFSSGYVTSMLAVSPWGAYFGAFNNLKQEFRSGGTELVFNYQPADTTKIQFAYGYSKPDGLDSSVAAATGLTTNDGTAWISYPNHQVKSNITHVLMNNRLIIHGALVYNSSYDVGKSGLLQIHDRSRTVIDLSIGYAFSKSLNIKASVKNLLGNNVPAVQESSDDGGLAGGSLGAGSYGLDVTAYYLTLTYKI